MLQAEGEARPLGFRSVRMRKDLRRNSRKFGVEAGYCSCCWFLLMVFSLLFVPRGWWKTELWVSELWASMITRKVCQQNPSLTLGATVLALLAATLGATQTFLANWHHRAAVLLVCAMAMVACAYKARRQGAGVFSAMTFSLLLWRTLLTLDSSNHLGRSDSQTCRSSAESHPISGKRPWSCSCGHVSNQALLFCCSAFPQWNKLKQFPGWSQTYPGQVWVNPCSCGCPKIPVGHSSRRNL